MTSMPKIKPTTEMSLTEGLCRSLAYHVVETELTLQFVDEPVPEMDEQVALARSLIELAGFDFDTLYPVADRPVAVATGPDGETMQ